MERRLAVIDLGSNSFRLVVFTHTDAWWKRTDEIYEPVRVGEHQEAGGPLQPEPMERALEAIELFAHFCRATGIERVRPLATSAIREASNRKAFVREAQERSGLEIQILSRAEEARYGYLAAVNSTTLSDGVALDIGGGSMQLTSVAERRAQDAGSWRLGAVVMTEAFLNAERTKPKHLRALRDHVREELRSAPWLGEVDGRITGIGGTVRNLGAAVMLERGLPSYGVQGFSITRDDIDDLVDRLAAMTPAERRRVPGIKPERGDLILAGATVVQTVLDAGGFGALEVTEAGLREGVLFEELLADRDEPLFEDVRASSVRNLAAQYHPEVAHTEHVARLALEIWDALADAGVHAGDPEERELLWAAAVLHDIGTAIDYEDHHRHSAYLVMNAGLPGFDPRELLLISLITRYHRKGDPDVSELGALAQDGDDERLRLLCAIIRLAEQLERSRDGAIRNVDVATSNGVVRLAADGDPALDTTVPIWAARQSAGLLAEALDREVEIA